MRGQQEHVWERRRFFLAILLGLLGADRGVKASVGLCTSSGLRVIITSPCRFSPGLHSFTSLEIRTTVVLDTTNSDTAHLFQITRDFTLGSGGVLEVGLNEQPSSGDGLYSFCGSYVGRG